MGDDNMGGKTQKAGAPSNWTLGQRDKFPVRLKIADHLAGHRVDPDGRLRWLADFEMVNRMEAAAGQVKRNLAIVRRFFAAQGIAGGAQITSESVQDYLIALGRAGRSAKTLHNHRGALSRYCRFLVARGVLEANPTAGVSVPRLEERLPIFLDPAECEQALAIAETCGIGCHVCLALNTGLRMTELRLLEWSNVHLRHRMLLVAKSKSRRPRKVPLNRAAMAALRQQQALTGRCRYVFPGRLGKPGPGPPTSRYPRGHEWWCYALKPLQAAIGKFRELPRQSTGRGWHLLRHTFASRLVQAGVSIYKVSQWLGHKDVQTTMIYAHLSPSFDPDIEKV